MAATIFVDTNVLIYAVDTADAIKYEAAQRWRAELWRNRSGRTSYQVLQEFYVKVCRKLPTAREQARAEVRDLLAWKPVVVDSTILEVGWKIQDRYQLSFWDALVVAAAKSIACPYLLTEDLQPDQDFDGLRVLNPFMAEPGHLADH